MVIAGEPPFVGRTGGADRLRQQWEKLIGLCALAFAIELVLFKFLPDLSTALLQHQTSNLTDFGEFEQGYLRPNSVHHARFLGNYILYYLAKALGSLYHSADVRLHPLRVAAGMLTPIYAFAGAVPALWGRQSFSWRYFLVLYSAMVVVGQYVFYPADMPSLALLSIGLWLLLDERLVGAWLLMLAVGLFRETSLHMVWFVAVWAVCSPLLARRSRWVWVLVFAAAFTIEYVLIRRLFPGPVSSAGTVILDPRAIFLDRGMLSLTTVCSLGLAALFPAVCLLRLNDIAVDDWRRRFFQINCYAFPGWIIFYRMMAGNLAEFRMLFPVLLPCIYGVAYAASARGRDAANRAQSGT